MNIKGLFFTVTSALLFGFTPVLASKTYDMGSTPETLTFYRNLLVVPILFQDWYHTHQALGDGIFFVLVGLAALSWVVTIVGHIRRWIDCRREDRISTEIYLRRMREAVKRGEIAPGGGYQVRVDDLWRDMD